VSGLRLESLRLRSFGVIAEEVDLGRFDPAITVITGPNETGKSTVVEALRCALFERHRAGHRGLKDLQCKDTDDPPEVWVVFRLGDVRHALHKRFLRQPSCSLRIEAEGLPPEDLVGDEAEARLRQVLGASTPGNRGASRDDMGAWGLLWVQQDEAAARDPGELLGSNARGTLQDVISRQVGGALGGTDGEALVAAIREEAGRWWTPTGRATGDQASARPEVERLRGEVGGLKRGVQVLEDLARQEQDQRAALDATERERTHTRAALADAEADEARARGLAEVVAEAELELELASGRLEVATHRFERRQALIAEVEELEDGEEEVQGRWRAAVEAATEAGEQRTAAEVEEARARAGREAARVAAQAAAEALADHRDRAARTVQRQVLQRARDLDAERGRLAERVEAGPDQEAWERLQDLVRRRSAAAERLREQGTRLEITASEGVQVHLLGRRETLEVAALGSVEVIPARPGLAELRRQHEEAEGRLASELSELGLADLEASREARVARQQDEAEAARLTALRSSLADEDTPTLATEAAEAVQKARADARACDEASSVGALVAEIEAELARETLDASGLAALEEKQRRAEAARARRDAVATRFSIEALQDIELVVDQAPATPLSAGQTRRLDAARRRTVVLGELARVVVEPGGVDAGAAEAEAAAAARDIAEALAAAGVDVLDTARRRVDSRRALQAEVSALRERLSIAAPDGLEAAAHLAREAERGARQAQDLLERVREVERDLAGLQRRLAAAPATEEAVARVLRAAEEARATQAELERSAAQLVFEVGPAVVAVEAVTGEREGVGWRLVPGLGGEQAQDDRDAAAAALADGLAAWGAGDLAAAAEARSAVRQDEGRLAAVEGALAETAPMGVETLAAAIGDLPDEDEPDADPEELEAAEREASETREETAEAWRVSWEALAEARTAVAEQGRVVEERAAEASRSAAALEGARKRLAAARAAEPDVALAEAVEAAVVTVTAAGTTLESARADLEAAGGASEAEGSAALRAALERLDGEGAKRRDQLVRTRTRIQDAAAEGRFETLKERDADLARSEELLARHERSAAAASRLLEVVEDHYQQAQRRFLAPVVQELAPYVRRLRPRSSLRLSPDFTVESVVRDGHKERFDRLSGGTREQLSVIVRIALARVLARDGLALPLVLDDVMGWTDDGRFDAMARILENAAQDLQVLILTCHPGRFARLGARRIIDLEELRAESA